METTRTCHIRFDLLILAQEFLERGPPQRVLDEEEGREILDAATSLLDGICGRAAGDVVL